jgi:hypothetical protein
MAAILAATPVRITADITAEVIIVLIISVGDNLIYALHSHNSQPQSMKQE